jgi:general secretion pathway protein L
MVSALPQRRLAGTVRAAWSWWIGELLALVPGRLRRIGGLRGQQVLIVDGRQAELVYELAGRRDSLGYFNAAASRPTKTVSRARRRRQTVVRLAAEHGLRTSLSLPLAAADNLGQVIAFEIERRTPFRREDVYFTHRILERDAKTRKVAVELTVAPRAVVDDALRVAAGIGLSVVGVEIAASPTVPTPSPNLLPQIRPAGRRSAFRIVVAILVLAIVGLGAAVVLTPLMQAQALAEDLARRVAEAKRQADAALALQKEIGEAAIDAQFLVMRRRQMPTISELLRTLTHLLPDDTWLTELQITSTEVQLNGYSNSATALLSVLDDAAGFSGAAFRSSLTHDSKLDRELFDITAKLKPRSGK